MASRSRPTGPTHFQHALVGASFSSLVTELPLLMDGNPNPGLSKPAIALGASVTWVFLAENAPGDWVLRLRKNQDVADVATIALPAGDPEVFSRTTQSWSLPVSFGAGELFHLLADGPSKRAILMRAVLLFEDCQQR